MAMNEGRSVLDDAEILLDMAPMLGLARVRKAEGHMMLGEWELASKQLRHVLETSPHHTHALTQLAACYMSMDRPERAESPLMKPSAIHLNMLQHGISEVFFIWNGLRLTTLFLTLKQRFAAMDNIWMLDYTSQHFFIIQSVLMKQRQHGVQFLP
jgi:hypothetical protein